MQFVYFYLCNYLILWQWYPDQALYTGELFKIVFIVSDSLIAGQNRIPLHFKAPSLMLEKQEGIGSLLLVCSTLGTI